MPRRRRRRQDQSDEAVGMIALVLGFLIYRQFSAVTFPWKIAFAALITSVAGTVIVWVVRSARRRRMQSIMLTDAMSLTPSEFEERIQYLLQDLGWERVERVGGSGDGGVDLRAVYQGQRYIVQCKRYNGRVGPQYLRDLEGARHHEQADRALLVTTGHFTQQGTAWVRGKPIDLWDGRVLAARFREQEIRRRDPERQHQTRQRTRWMLGGLAALNVLVLLWATVSAPVFSPASEAATVPDQPATSVKVVAEDQPIPEPSPTATLCGTATISGVERLVLRAAPGLQSAKIADYAAGTEVQLSCDEAVSADGLLWQAVVIDERTGWMSQRMLQRQR